MEPQEINVKEITFKSFSEKNVKIMIVGNETFNHDSPIDKFILDLIKHQGFQSGSVLSHVNKVDQYYSYCCSMSLCSMSLYKRYSAVLKNRIFKDDTYFILDNLVLLDEVFKEIQDNLHNKHMLAIFYYPSIVPYINLDYMILTESTDDYIMQIAYDTVKGNYDIPYESFVEIIQDFINEKYFAVVKYKNKTLKVIKL